MKTIKLPAASREFLEGCSKTLIFIKNFLLVAGFESVLPLLGVLHNLFSKQVNTGLAINPDSTEIKLSL